MHTIREQSGVRNAVDNAKERWPGAEDAWDATVWTIARDPTMGKALSEGGKVRQIVLEGARSIGLPTVNATYEIEDDGIITIHEVTFSDATAARAGHA